jgi:hypothetical protein
VLADCDGDRYLDLAADAPAAVRRVLDTETDDSDRVRLESRFVDEVCDDEIRLRI